VQPSSPLKRHAAQEMRHAVFSLPGSKKLRWRLWESQQQ
jgi:hypothetical protein